MLELINIYKKHDDKNILSNINFVFFANGFYLIHGENGAGKTSLLYILAGLDRSFDGKLKFEGKTITPKNINAYCSYIGYINQEPILFDDWTVEQNLNAINKYSKRELVEVLIKVRINENLLSQKAETLSQGEKQRIAIARALLRKPKVLLCDEITSNLDSLNAQNIVNVLFELSKDVLVVFVTHEIKAIYRKEFFLVALENGKIVSTINSNNIKENKINTAPIIRNNGKKNSLAFLKRNKGLLSIVSISVILLSFFGVSSGFFQYSSNEPYYVTKNGAYAQIDSSNAVVIKPVTHYNVEEIKSVDQSLLNDFMDNIPKECIFGECINYVFEHGYNFSFVKTNINNYSDIYESDLLYDTKFPDDINQILMPKSEFDSLASVVSKTRGISTLDAINYILDNPDSFFYGKTIVGVFNNKGKMSNELYNVSFNSNFSSYTQANALLLGTGFVTTSEIVKYDKSLGGVILTSGNELLLKENYKRITISPIVPEINYYEKSISAKTTMSLITNLSYLYAIGMLSVGLVFIFGLSSIITFWFANKRSVLVLQSMGTKNNDILKQCAYFALFSIVLPSLIGALLGLIAINRITLYCQSQFYVIINCLSPMIPDLFYILISLIALIAAIWFIMLKLLLKKGRKEIVNDIRSNK